MPRDNEQGFEIHHRKNHPIETEIHLYHQRGETLQNAEKLWDGNFVKAANFHNGRNWFY